MPERFVIAEHKAREREIANAIRRAARELPKSPTASSWERYRESLRTDLRDSMIASAEVAARMAGRHAGVSYRLPDETLRQIERLAREQAKLIASNSMTAVRESAGKLRRMGLTNAETSSVIEIVSGLNRKQAGAIVHRVRTGLSQGKRLHGIMRGLGAKGERYLSDRANRIGMAQGRRAAGLGANTILESIEGATKRWVTQPGACDVCVELEEMGEIAATEPFLHPEGFEVFGADVHLNCLCFAEHLFQGAGDLLSESELEDIIGEGAA